MKNKHLIRARISEADFRLLLRQRVVALAEAEIAPFRQGTVEIDESYFGPRRVRGRRGRGAARKIPVIGLLKRDGKVFTQIVANCSKARASGRGP